MFKTRNILVNYLACKYFSMEVIAFAPSAVAVITCFNCLVLTSPATKTPGIDVTQVSSASMYPLSSTSGSPMMDSVFGVVPTAIKTPSTESSLVSDEILFFAKTDFMCNFWGRYDKHKFFC